MLREKLFRVNALCTFATTTTTGEEISLLMLSFALDFPFSLHTNIHTCLHSKGVEGGGGTMLSNNNIARTNDLDEESVLAGDGNGGKASG